MRQVNAEEGSDMHAQSGTQEPYSMHSTTNNVFKYQLEMLR